MWLAREFVSKGYLVSITASELNIKNQIKGAYIKHIAEEKVLVPQYLVAEGDFFSLYPSIIVAHNISPENIITEGGNQIDLNIGVCNTKEMIGFATERQAILPGLVEPLLTLRQKEEDPVRK
jgi:DNA polymerase elongation subunit (family B)